MRTTLNIADDVLAAANAIAKEQGQTVGKVISDLARETLNKSAIDGFRNGVPLLKVRDSSRRVTLQWVNAMRDESD